MSSVLDLYADDFPHGTKAGFDRGCRTNAACSNFGGDYLTCTEAAAARRTDYSLRKLPDEQLIARAAPAPEPKPARRTGSASDSLLAPLGTHKPKKTPPTEERTAMNQIDPEPAFERASEREQREKTTPVPKPSISPAATVKPVDVPDEAWTDVGHTTGGVSLRAGVDPHDTMTTTEKLRHYWSGCREEPCRIAMSAYQRERRTARAAAAATETSSEVDSTPATEPPADENQVRETEATTPSRDGGEQGPERVATPEPSHVEQAASTSPEPDVDHGPATETPSSAYQPDDAAAWIDDETWHKALVNEFVSTGGSHEITISIDPTPTYGVELKITRTSPGVDVDVMIASVQRQTVGDFSVATLTDVSITVRSN